MKIWIIVILGVIIIGLSITPFILDSNESSKNSQENTNSIINNAKISNESNPQTKSIKYTLSEIQNHNTKQNCYTIINGKAYNLTEFIDKHMGGSEKILNLCGKDGSSAFTNKHGENEKAIKTLESFYIGEVN